MRISVNIGVLVLLQVARILLPVQRHYIVTAQMIVAFNIALELVYIWCLQLYHKYSGSGVEKYVRRWQKNKASTQPSSKSPQKLQQPIHPRPLSRNSMTPSPSRSMGTLSASPTNIGGFEKKNINQQQQQLNQSELFQKMEMIKVHKSPLKADISNLTSSTQRYQYASKSPGRKTNKNQSMDVSGSTVSFEIGLDLLQWSDKDLLMFMNLLKRWLHDHVLALFNPDDQAMQSNVDRLVNKIVVDLHQVQILQQSQIKSHVQERLRYLLKDQNLGHYSVDPSSKFSISDSHIILMSLIVYLDQVFKSLNYGDNHFSTKFVTMSRSDPNARNDTSVDQNGGSSVAPAPGLCQLYIKDQNPLHINLLYRSKLWQMPSGKFNLFYALCCFFKWYDIKYLGFIDTFNIHGGSRLGMILPKK
ncbi:hypothetical protein MP228_013119 [Amoeboaphelidium protococcarum]|nr:hypothetical protein MP228_013119 [Amoeboaphelidium protococcarum]